MKGLFLALPLVALGATACGSKAKPKSTVQADDGSATSEDRGPETTTAAPPVQAANDASLQQVIYFAFDSAELDEASRTKLNENAEWLKKDPSRTLTIEGHTDEVGTAEYNLGLGERRARATKDYLVRLGVPEKRLSIITYGEERPAGNEDSLNRRSMFIATKKP